GDRLRDSLKPLLALHGATPVAEFGPRRLKEVRANMVASGRLCRQEINARVQCVRRVFRWAVSEEIAPAAVAVGLETVASLRPSSDLREGVKREPVEEAVVWATLPHLSPTIAGIIELAWHTGARP